MVKLTSIQRNIVQAIFYRNDSGPFWDGDHISGMVVQMRGQYTWMMIWNGEYPE